MTKQEKLIAHYEKQLEAVKQAWTGKTDALGNEGSAYIEFAEKQLEAVKNGREW
jgi:hypothetical protein